MSNQDCGGRSGRHCLCLRRSGNTGRKKIESVNKPQISPTPYPRGLLPPARWCHPKILQLLTKVLHLFPHMGL